MAHWHSTTPEPRAARWITLFAPYPCGRCGREIARQSSILFSAHRDGDPTPAVLCARCVAAAEVA